LEDVENTFSLDILRAFQVELALDQGDLAQARRLSQLVDFDMNRTVWYHYMLQLTPIKLWLAEGRAKSLKKAHTALEQLKQQLLGMNRKTHSIDVLALQALAFEAQGERRMAEESLTTALRLGEPGGFIRSFVDLGPPMADLLTRLQKQEVAEMEAYISRILAAFQMEQPDTTAPDLDHPLTKREMQTLRLLATDLSHRAHPRAKRLPKAGGAQPF
jgi:LuxR family maltose regulon positive regulatory protein